MRLTSNYGVRIALAGASDNTDEVVIQQDNSKNCYIKNEASQPIYFQTGSSNTTRVAIRHSGSAGIDVYGKSMANTVDSWVKHMSTLEASLERIEGGNWEIDFGTIDSLDPYQLGLSTLREYNIVLKQNGRIISESENGWENIIQIF